MQMAKDSIATIVIPLSLTPFPHTTSQDSSLKMDKVQSFFVHSILRENCVFLVVATPCFDVKNILYCVSSNNCTIIIYVGFAYDKILTCTVLYNICPVRMVYEPQISNLCTIDKQRTFAGVCHLLYTVQYPLSTFQAKEQM